MAYLRTKRFANKEGWQITLTRTSDSVEVGPTYGQDAYISSTDNDIDAYIDSVANVVRATLYGYYYGGVNDN